MFCWPSFVWRLQLQQLLEYSFHYIWARRSFENAVGEEPNSIWIKSSSWIRISGISTYSQVIIQYADRPQPLALCFVRHREVSKEPTGSAVDARSPHAWRTTVNVFRWGWNVETTAVALVAKIVLIKLMSKLWIYCWNPLTCFFFNSLTTSDLQVNWQTWWYRTTIYEFRSNSWRGRWV